MAVGVKRWFMLQMWRLQQIAQVATIALLALNLALQIYNYMSWRGSLFSSPYTGVPILLLILVAIIWGVAIIWDLRLKMWREQMTVIAERNPYMLEKMSAKELLMFDLVWLPLLDRMAEENPDAKNSAHVLRAWMKKVAEDDPRTREDAEQILRRMGDVHEDDPLRLRENK